MSDGDVHDMGKMTDTHVSEPNRLSAPVINVNHKSGGHGPGAAMLAENPVSRLNEPGVGLEKVDHRVLVYGDLIGAHTWPDEREPTREIELHLTGNMEKYMWSFDGIKFTEVEGPVEFQYGERLRLILVNDTMMEHPIHLHGMWMELENGQYPRPRKHTISLKPSEVVSLQISADAPGSWAFHCHLLYHMKAGMFRVVSVA
jgi:FtsP/CotA-like multicopper oxidase with cupredoxin domain